MDLKKRLCFARGKKRPGGFTLLETLVGMLIMSGVMLGFAKYLHVFNINNVRDAKRIELSRMGLEIQARLQGMNFHHLYPKQDPWNSTHGPDGILFCDSSLPDFGLAPGHPEVAAFTQLRDHVKKLGLRGFKIEMAFCRRDSASTRVVTANILAWVKLENYWTENRMVNGTLRQVYYDPADPSVYLVDQNADGDYYDIWEEPAFSKIWRSEMPDTHVKVLTTTLYDQNGKASVKHAEVITLEKLSGKSPSITPEDMIRFRLYRPREYSYILEYVTSAQKAAADLAIDKVAYKTGDNCCPHYYRVGGGWSFPLDVETEGLATAKLFRSYPYPSSVPLDSFVADSQGVVGWVNAPGMTNELLTNPAEGDVWAHGYTEKQGKKSGIRAVIMYMDRRPPEASNPLPIGSRPPGMPTTISANLVDQPKDPGPGRYATGIRTDVVVLKYKVNGGGWNVCSPQFSGIGNGVRVTCGQKPSFNSLDNVEVEVQGGDKAGYKVKLNWSFTVN